ncbi:hypothetical protein SO802_017583 [Lithocarpus litseifolius]|uniref:Uncharacterized protein n=1 Tax=Lithocarpus litseifolius TaxID=425828 RepID=A0AAW2CN89_9ROSI
MSYSSYRESNFTFPPFFSPTYDFNPIIFLQVSAPYSGRGNTSRVLVWYNILTKETRGHFRAAGFEPLIRLILKSLDDELSIQLGANLFGRRYVIETIRYTDLKADFMHFPQQTAEECLQMARLILLYLLEAYLFANSRQMVSLRWLVLFQDFERARPPIKDELDYDEFSRTRLIPSFTVPEGPTTSALIDAPRLPWLVYAYSPNSFARECPVGHNTNVTGYPFPKGTQTLYGGKDTNDVDDDDDGGDSARGLESTPSHQSRKSHFR